MSIPQLFYFGILAGIITRIPGLDIGSFIFAFHLHTELYLDNFRKSLIKISIVGLGFLITIMIPLSRFDFIIYHYSDLILSFLMGIFLYSALYIWMNTKKAYKLKELILAATILICLIVIKSYQIKLGEMDNAWGIFLHGFSILIPGLHFPPLESITFFAIIIFLAGILLSLVLLVRTKSRGEQLRPIIVATLLASICDLWPWRAFQSLSYSLNGVRWIKDYPVLPELDLKNIAVVIIFFLVGIMSSWIITKTYSNRIIPVHE